MATEPSPVSHIRLTSHPVEGTQTALPIRWGAPDPHVRGPIVGSTTNRSQRNVIGTHSGSYGVYRGNIPLGAQSADDARLLRLMLWKVGDVRRGDECLKCGLQ